MNVNMQVGLTLTFSLVKKFTSKICKFIATSGFLAALHQIRFPPGLRPADPAGGAHEAPQRPPIVGWGGGHPIGPILPQRIRRLFLGASTVVRRLDCPAPKPYVQAPLMYGCKVDCLYSGKTRLVSVEWNVKPYYSLRTKKMTDDLPLALTCCLL